MVGVLAEAVVSPPHALVFLVDPTGEPEIPPDTSAAVVTHTASAIAVWTQTEADGPTVIRIVSGQPTDMELVFDGTLATPGRTLAVHNSSLDTYLCTSVASSQAHIRIWVDDTEDPSFISVQLVPSET